MSCPMIQRVRSAFQAVAALLVACVSASAGAAPLHWVPVGPPGNPSITAMAVGKADYVIPFPARPSLLYASTTGAGVFRSADAGLTWTSTGSGLPGDATALALRQVFLLGVDTGSYLTTVFAGTAGGVYRLAPGATSWVASNTGLTSLDVRALAVSGNGVVLSGNSGIAYAGTAGGLFASTDGGITWVPKTAGLPSGSDGAITALAADPATPSTLYTGTAAGLFKSIDGGETWSKLDTGGSFKISVSTIAVDPLVPSRVFVAGIASPPCYPLCLAPSFMTSLRSLDGGATWSTIGGLAGNFVRAFAATSTLPSRVFAGTAGSGVFESSDGGVTWAAFNDGLGSASVSSLVIDPVLPSLVFAGTAQGVFCAPLGQVAPTCATSGQTLCLNGHRFSASVVWRNASHVTGGGQALSVTDNTGAFWFFDPTNLELAVKILDGRSVNGKYWVFFGSLTNVEFTLTVTDTLTGAVKTYLNPQGQLASGADTSAF